MIKSPPIKGQLWSKQGRRSQLLAKINRRVNEQLTLGQGLFAVGGRCLYTVEVFPDNEELGAYAKVMVFSTAVTSGVMTPNLFCNATLYGDCKYWGEITEQGGEWVFSRITNIKQSRSVYSAGFMFSFDVELADLNITQSLLDELFGRYIKDAIARRQLIANQLTGRAQG